MSSKFAILGGGPSAAFAFQALLDAGFYGEDIVVYGRPTLPPPGAFWFHWIPDSINVLSEKMLIMGIGKAEIYSKKMWEEIVPTSFPVNSRYEVVFSPEEAMRKMFIGAEFIDQGIMTDDTIGEIMRHGHREVFCTFPPQVIRNLEFYKAFSRSNPTWVAKLPLDGEERLPVCAYDGSTTFPWVRTTVYQGVVSVEFPRLVIEEDLRNLKEIRQVDGAIHNVPDIHPNCPEIAPTMFRRIAGEEFGAHFHLLGRFSTYERKALSHDAYNYVTQILKENNHV